MAAPTPPEVRRAGPEDALIITAFNAALAEESEGKLLDRQRLREGVRALLDDPAKGFYVLAERSGEVLGQLMITQEWSDWRNGYFWWIQSVYVVPAHRRTGVFETLFRHVERQARRQGAACGLRLYVDDRNTSAQAVYAALGMARTQYDMFELDFTG